MRTAIIGGGIAGLSAAYELARTGKEFVLYEATQRLGGIIETVRRDGFVVECGPDSWVAEKPWARELAIEVGLAGEIIPSNDHLRQTYIVQGKSLVPMPDGMRMMVPANIEALLHSPLFSEEAKRAYLREPGRAAELKASAPAEDTDESVSSFVRRHFGDEVTDTIAAPLLAGVFGGSIDRLSARAVMPAFIKMEREHGSLMTALQKHIHESEKSAIFATLKPGLQTLIDRMAEALPATSVRLGMPVSGLSWNNGRWSVSCTAGSEQFDAVIVAAPADVTRSLLRPLDFAFDELLAMDASSAIVIALAFPPERAKSMRIPRGFGFLVPPAKPGQMRDPQLLACTFVDQKFSHRAPDGAVLLRAFFGGEDAPQLLKRTDEEVAALACRQLSLLLGDLPEASFTVIRRWPRSLPQYAVGHMARMKQLADLAQSFAGLYLIGNAYYGVGLPDLIREGRKAARQIADHN
ncbi:MAG TPA: protoporphyrinogen oxidase [Pseudacidobacterium sp.]|nr:protoporphyrinogen oxidase [Pseudacidobacterium sp.]